MANNAPKLLQPSPVPLPEQILSERYDQLRAWAVGLTRGDVNVAYDIVHDLYLYVTLRKPDFSRVESPDHYLYKCLRHLHLAYLAKSSRNALQQISVAELDSLHFALWASPESYLLERQNELRRICHYAVRRKEQIKSASFFVLRFFHGYRLQEIGEITNLSISVVQPKLSRMRSEIAKYLEEPCEQQFARMAAEGLFWTSVSSLELFRELRATILGARTGECLEEADLLAHYLTPVPKPISGPLLSHIVSCERCLSIVDRHFRRPTLRDREPLDAIGGERGNSRKGGGGPQRIGHREMLQTALGHRRDVHEHRPRLLSIAVDGRIIASHQVQAQRSVQSARIERPEQVGCVDVYSEQDVHLALVLLEGLPPQGPLAKVEHIELSDGRWIEVRLTFDSLGLNSEVTYFDPMLPADASERALDNDAELRPVPAFPEEGREDLDQTASTPAKLARKKARRHQAPPWSLPLATWWRRLSPTLKRMMLPNMSPLLAGALILAVGSMACLFSWMYKQPRLAPSALLDLAAKWDSEGAGNVQPGVIYQKVRITTRRRTLERTIYRDVQGLRHPRRQQLSTEDEQLKNRLAGAGVNWNAPLSAADYSQWRYRSGAIHDAVMRSGQHLLTLTTTPIAPSAVLKETLTVRDTDFHAVDRTIVLRDSGTVEIAELNYDLLPWGAVNQDWFEPVSGATATDAPGILPAVGIHASRLLSELELDETELEARLALNRLQADTGERIHLGRGAERIEVKGVVDTDQRKRQLVSELSQIPHVQTSILSVQELGNRPLSDSASLDSKPIQVYSVEAQASPLEQYLRAHELPMERLASISHNLVDGGLRIQQAEVHFSELASRFSKANQLPADLQNQLAALSRNYLDNIDAGLDANQRILRSLGLGNAGWAAAFSESSSPKGDINHEVLLYQGLCLELIGGGTGQSRPAAVIADELMNTSAQIRQHLAQMSETVPRALN